MSEFESGALSNCQPATPAVSSNEAADSVPGVSRALAFEVRESCVVGDHAFHSMPVLRAVRGFQQIIFSALFRTQAPAACTLPSSQVVLVAANPVAHGARLIASIRKSVSSSTFSVLADARLGEEGLLIEHSFPGISANSLRGFVSGQRLAFAVKLRFKLPRGTSLVGSTSRLYREYLFIAQAVRYAACRDAVTKIPQTTVLVTDFDRSAYARPWVWAANSAGMKTATMMHGSPNEANYVPVLARHSLVWGSVQKQWIEQRSPGVEVQVVGRPDLQGAVLSKSIATPRVVLCHSREQLSPSETETLITQLSRFRSDGHSITLRLHPSATVADLDERWQKVAGFAHDIVVSRGSFVSSVCNSDLVICVASSSAVEAIAAGVAAIVVADDSRILPSDLEAIRSASPEVLHEFATHVRASTASTPHLDNLVSQILGATGTRASHLLDSALVKIRTEKAISIV